MENQGLGPREVSRVSHRASEGASVVSKVRRISRRAYRPQGSPRDPWSTRPEKRRGIKLELIGDRRLGARLQERLGVTGEHPLDAPRLPTEARERRRRPWCERPQPREDRRLERRQQTVSRRIGRLGRRRRQLDAKERRQRRRLGALERQQRPHDPAGDARSEASDGRHPPASKQLPQHSGGVVVARRRQRDAGVPLLGRQSSQLVEHPHPATPGSRSHGVEGQAQLPREAPEVGHLLGVVGLLVEPSLDRGHGDLSEAQRGTRVGEEPQQSETRRVGAHAHQHPVTRSEEALTRCERDGPPQRELDPRRACAHSSSNSLQKVPSPGPSGPKAASRCMALG